MGGTGPNGEITAADLEPHTEREPENPEGKPLPGRFAVKVARLADGPAAGRVMRVKKRAILVPFWLNSGTELNTGPRPVLIFLKYRRAPGIDPDGAQRYVHVLKDGAW